MFPLFVIRINILIKKIIEDKLTERFGHEDLHDCFLIEIKETPTKNKLVIYVDSDSGMTLKKCSIISKYLQYFIDEENLLGENYGLEVSSPGVDRPLLHYRQYVKNLGRNFHIILDDNSSVKGKLIAIDEEEIKLSVKLDKKEAKKMGKKEEEVRISFSNIKEAKIKVSFK